MVEKGNKEEKEIHKLVNKVREIYVEQREPESLSLLGTVLFNYEFTVGTV